MTALILKKITTIFFLIIVLFNTGGYRFAFSYLENTAITHLEKAIERGNYNKQHLIEIKIPLNMPYFSDRSYEVAYGETEIEGTHYQYVKKKVSNNTLYLLCLPNTEKTSLITTKNDIEKNNSASANNKSDKKNSSPSLTKPLQEEYVKTSFECKIFNGLSLKAILLKRWNSKVGDLFTALTPSQPPEFCI